MVTTAAGLIFTVYAYTVLVDDRYVHGWCVWVQGLNLQEAKIWRQETVPITFKVTGSTKSSWKCASENQVSTS